MTLGATAVNAKPATQTPGCTWPANSLLWQRLYTPLGHFIYYLGVVSL